MLLVCVPLIPVSIVIVQKIAKRLLKNYWGQYAKPGDHFLENLQGLTTLKIYQSDEARHQEMNKDAVPRAYIYVDPGRNRLRTDSICISLI